MEEGESVIEDACDSKKRLTVCLGGPGRPCALPTL